MQDLIPHALAELQNAQGHQRSSGPLAQDGQIVLSQIPQGHPILEAWNWTRRVYVALDNTVVPVQTQVVQQGRARVTAESPILIDDADFGLKFALGMTNREREFGDYYQARAEWRGAQRRLSRKRKALELAEALGTLKGANLERQLDALAKATARFEYEDGYVSALYDKKIARLVESPDATRVLAVLAEKPLKGRLRESVSGRFLQSQLYPDMGGGASSPEFWGVLRALRQDGLIYFTQLDQEFRITEKGERALARQRKKQAARE